MTTRLTDADPLTDVDRDAMTRAIEMCRSENKGRRHKIDQKLKDEKWRRVGRFCPSAVHSSNEKSLLLQGLIAREFIQRIRGLGQSGGGRGTGIEPSPGTPS